MQSVPLEIDGQIVGWKGLSRRGSREIDLATRKPGIPKDLRHWRDLLFHMRQRTFRSDRTGIWEPFKQGRQAEEVVTVAVGDVDVSKVLVGKEILDPICKSVALVDSKEWVD